MQILQGGISSIKNVATSVAKKFDEMKDVISNEQMPRDSRMVNEDQITKYSLGSRRSEPDLWGHSTDSSYNNLIFLGEHLAKNFPNTNQSKCPQISLAYTENSEFGDIEIQMSTSTPYHKCKKQMTDKDIMIGWSAEDSNLNTFCDECDKFTVPVLSVAVTTQKTQNEQHSFPYLNPLVLRKELENILVQHGDNCLCKTNFVDEHPIIYWNLLWFMQRIGVETHLSELFFNKTVRFGAFGKLSISLDTAIAIKILGILQLVLKIKVSFLVSRYAAIHQRSQHANDLIHWNAYDLLINRYLD